jgi:hypothetical protein
LNERVVIGREPVTIVDVASHGGGGCKVGAQIRSPLHVERASIESSSPRVDTHASEHWVTGAAQVVPADA